MQDLESLFHAAVAALTEEDWAQLATLVDPVHLASARTSTLEDLRRESSNPLPSVDELARHQPDAPRAMLEFQIEEMRRQQDPVARLHEMFPTVPTLGALEALTPQEFGAAWLRGRSISEQIVWLGRTGALSPEEIAAMKAMQRRAVHFVYLGHVPDGPRWAHLIYRLATREGAGGAIESGGDGGSQDLPMATKHAGIEHRHASTLGCLRQPDGAWRFASLSDLSTIGGSSFAFVRTTTDAESSGDSDLRSASREA
jgi:hypothetical protein